MIYIKRYWQQILIILLFLLLIFAIQQCSQQKQWKQEYRENFKQQKDSFKSVINDKGQQLAIQKEKVISKKDKVNQLEDSIDQLSQINRQLKAQTKTTIKEKRVVIDSPVYIDSTKNRYLKTPATFAKENKWYNIEGTITDTGFINFKNISFINKPIITIGEKDEGFINNLNPFNENEILVTYKDRNPYTRVQSMNNIKIKDEVKTDKVIGLGITTGYGFTPNGTGLFIGAGITYTPIMLY